MIGHRSIGIRTLTLGCLLTLVTVSFWTWLFIWDSELFSDRSSVQRYMLYNEFLLVGILFGSGRNSTLIRGPYREFIEAVRRSGRQTAIGVFGVFIVVFAVKDASISRSFFFSFLPLLGLTLVFSNYLVPIWLGQWSFSGDRRERVALAGTLEQASRIKPWLERKSLLGLRTIGVVCPEPTTESRLGGHGTNGMAMPFPVLGGMDAMSEILEKASITQLIVLDLSLGSERLRKLAHLCEGASVRMLAVHNLDSYFTHTTMTFEDDGVRFVGLRDEPLESPINRCVKRAMDVAIALPVVLLVLPVMTAVVWLLHRLQSRGPVFYSQMRSGMMGRPFKILKYRTMHTKHQDEARQASNGDPRIYPAGRWLRKLSIDEFPQFLNVLKGEMSVVGPRPHLEKHEEMWAREMRRYVIRRFIRPGITGWAQVEGFRGEIHSEADIQKRVEADIHYLENWSFSLDCAIVLRTVTHCFTPPKTAY